MRLVEPLFLPAELVSRWANMSSAARIPPALDERLDEPLGPCGRHGAEGNPALFALLARYGQVSPVRRCLA